MPQAKTDSERTVLVTGGAGYVGSILLRRLLGAGYRVVCVDVLTHGGRSLVGVWDHPRFHFAKIDITDHEAVDEVVDEYDPFGIVHLAAIVGDPACKREPERAVRVNRDASVHLLEKAISAGVRRFVFASTCSNYGKMEDSAGYVDETSPLAPVSLYAELKVEFEKRLLEGVERREGFSPTALRFATVYGMSHRTRFDLTVNEFTKELVLGRELVVYGQQFWRPYCHVRDLSTAIRAVLEAPEKQVAYDVFNVGQTEENYTKRMLVDELLEQIPDGRIRYVHKEEDPRDYRVRFGKIRDRLGFRISRTVPQGIRDIRTGIRLGIIADPDDPRHYNIPVEPPDG